MKRLWKILLASLVIAGGVHAAEVDDLEIVDASNTARFPESQAPSSLNNAARALEGIIARWYKDWNGSLATAGSADAYTLSANQTISAYFDGLTLTFEATATNTGPSTLNVDAVGAATIAKYGAVELESGDIANGQKYTVVYDGTRFQLVTPVTPFASTVTSGNIPLFSGTTGRFTDSGYTPSTLPTDSSGLASVQTFATSDTWTKPAGITKVIVEVIGGGGSGGGSGATSTNEAACGGGGGGGGYAKKLVTSPEATATVTIGAAGAAPSAGANNGNTGGTTSWDDLVTAVTATGGGGGVGGATSTLDALNIGGAGGTGSGGDINAVGGPGAMCATTGGGGGDVAVGGAGGASFIGGGANSTVAAAGAAGSTKGSGGSGASASVNTAARAGGAGADGLVIVWEFK